MSTDEMQAVGGASDAGADGRWGGRGGPDELLVPDEGSGADPFRVQPRADRDQEPGADRLHA